MNTFPFNNLFFSRIIIKFMNHFFRFIQRYLNRKGFFLIIFQCFLFIFHALQDFEDISEKVVLVFSYPEFCSSAKTFTLPPSVL